MKLIGSLRRLTAPKANPEGKSRRLIKRRCLFFLAGTLVLLILGCASALGQGSAFTYQARITERGDPAEGLYDFRFRLWDTAAGGNQMGADQEISAVAVTSGAFSVVLDFGYDPFNGDPRWLEIGVRTNGAPGGYTPLSPRQLVTPVPYALFASRASSADAVQWSNIGGVPAGYSDGVDNDTLYAAGAGLTLGSGNLFSVRYGGSGTSSSAARSDHDHLGQGWSAAQTRGLSVTTTLAAGVGVAGLLGRQGNGAGAALILPAGIWGDSSDGLGVLGTTVLVNGAGVEGWHFPTHGSGAGVYGVTASDNGRGVYGLASAGTGTNYGVYGETESPDGYGICAKNADGVALKAAGTGIIQSSARSSFFVPGSLLQPGSSSAGLRLDCTAYGAQVKSSAAGDAVCVLPLTVPAVLFGQPVTLKSVTVLYRCENGANNYITASALYKMLDADTVVMLVNETSNHTSNTPGNYLLVPLTGATLSTASGAVTAQFTLHFANNTDYIQLAGVKVELAHE